MCAHFNFEKPYDQNHSNKDIEKLALEEQELYRLIKQKHYNLTDDEIAETPKKVWKKVSEFGVEAGPAVVIGLVVFFGAEWYHAKLAHDHRD